MNPQMSRPDTPSLGHEQVQRALQESETRLRSALDSALMVLWVVDLEGVFTFAYGKGLEALGLRTQDVVGRSVFDLYADQPEILEDHRRAIAGEEFMSIREVGGIVFENRFSTLLDENGSPAGLIGIAVDITDRRRAELDRERALSLLRASLESTADGILVVDREGAIVTHNTKFAEMWGIPQEVLESGDDERAIGHVLEQLRDPDGFVGRVMELYSSPEAQSFDVLHFKNGRIFERYSQPQRVGDQVVGRVWSFRDVTERRRTEIELRERESQLQHTQRLARLGSWQWDIHANVVVWTDELYRIYGLDRASHPATFEGYLERVHPDDRDHVRASLEAALAAGSTFEFTERIIRPGGEIRALRSQGEVVLDEAGVPVRMIGACQDITEQQLAEQALRNAEASYRAIFDLSNDAIFIHDIETGTIVDANHAACELGQCSLEELKELGVVGISDGRPPYTGAEAMAYVGRAAAGEPQRFEWLVRRRASDERVWVEVDLRRVAINGVERLLANVRDITDRKAAEAVLKRSHEELEMLVADRTSELAQTNMALEEEIAERERAEEELSERSTELEAIFRALPDLYFRLDPAGRILDHRSGRDSTLVLPPEAYVGEMIQDILPEGVRAELDAALADVSRTGSLYRLEYAMTIDDDEREFEARFLPLGDGHIISLVRDITDRQRAEEALRKREEHYRRLIENSSDVATILGPDGINRYQSPAIEYVLGHKPEEMVGTSAFERIHPEDAPLCKEVLGRVLLNPGTTHAVEFRYRHGDGSWRVLEARARTLLPDSAAEGAVINSRDVTERKRYEEALRLAKEEAETANRAKSEFLSRMSHELRTPMNSILGFGQLLERKQLPPDQKRGVDHILKAGRHLLNLINEVLEIARIEAGRQNFSLEPVRVASVLREARSLIQPLAGQRDLTIEDCFVDEELYVRADRQRLVQVLLNLLSNAVKYNRPEGSVAVECEVVDADGGEKRVRIGVRDTGDGIPPEKLDRLFIPFDRLGAEQSQEEGTGLGLALSQRLVDAMGGTLSVESVVHQGSTFWIELPRGEEPVAGSDRGAERRNHERPDPAGRPPATLLYIEDNLANLALIESILADRPELTVLSALQGQMGVYLAVEHRPELILLDMHLPDIDGDEVLRRLQSDPRTRDTPVVMVSADATPSTIERLTRMGASGYLTKPLDVGEFLEVVERYLVRPRELR
jgi:PAS domain S-box-containing protein